MNKLKIIYVGALKQPKDGFSGGQLFACLSLLASPISERVEWIKIDSTQRSVPPPSFWIRSLAALSRIIRLIRALVFEKADAALIFSSSGTSLYEKGVMACCSNLLGVPVIFAPRGGGAKNMSKRQRKIVRFFLRRTQYILCQSSQWQTFYEQLTGLPSERLVVIMNWIDMTPYQNMETLTKSDKTHVLFLGHVLRLKGIYDLLEAVAAEKEAFSHTLFVICGGGRELKAFRLEVNSRKLAEYFDIRGWVVGDKKMNALKEADIFVLPSHAEGMPNSILEAMAAGKAVISSNVGGVPDMISHEKNGLLYDVGNVKELGQHLKRLILDSRERLKLGQKARKCVMEQHNINTVWPKILAVIRSAADRHQTR